MEPKGGPGGFGGPGGPGPGGPPLAGPGGRPGPGGPDGFGPAMFVAPMFMTQGDENHDGQLSRDEFARLSEKWFSNWDKKKTGKLDEKQIREGLNASFSMGSWP